MTTRNNKNQISNQTQKKTNMLSCTISTKLMKNVVDAMKDMLTDVNFGFSETGLRINSMDSSHVSLVAIQLNNECFEQYSLDSNTTLGINLLSFGNIVKSVSDSDKLTLTSKCGDVLNITCESDKRDFCFQYELKLMCIDTEHVEVPETDYKCRVRMSSVKFNQIVRQLSVFGDTVKISMNADGVSFGVEGSEGKANIEGRNMSGENIVIDRCDESSQAYAMRYIAFFCKAAPLADTVILEWSEGIPLHVEYRIEEKYSVNYYLAPKIDDS